MAAVSDGRAALERWEMRRPDAELLDLGLPDMEGLRIIRRIGREAATPVVVLTAMGEESTRVAALDQGADEYVAEPAGMAELNARLRAALCRAAGPAADADGLLISGPLSLDTGRHVASVGSRPLALTPRGFEILRVLLSDAGRVVTRPRLLRAVWGEAYRHGSRCVHLFVIQLRGKLGAAVPPGGRAWPGATDR